MRKKGLRLSGESERIESEKGREAFYTMNIKGMNDGRLERARIWINGGKRTSIDSQTHLMVLILDMILHMKFDAGLIWSYI